MSKFIAVFVSFLTLSVASASNFGLPAGQTHICTHNNFEGRILRWNLFLDQTSQQGQQAAGQAQQAANFSQAEIELVDLTQGLKDETLYGELERTALGFVFRTYNREGNRVLFVANDYHLIYNYVELNGTEVVEDLKINCVELARL